MPGHEHLDDARDDRLLELVRASAVRDEEVGGAATAELVRKLARDVVAAEPLAVRPRRRPLARYALVAAAALSIGLLSAFAYETLGARTGWFGDPASTETDGSEWLRTDASDFGDVVSGLVPSLPLPEGARWADEIERLVEQGAAAPALRQVTGVRGGFAFFAQCAWLTAWDRAYGRGDTAGMAASVAVLATAPEWEEFAPIDGGGVRDSMRHQAELAQRGDRDALRPWIEGCSGFPLAGVR